MAILGLCLGSFATALIYRIPRNIPWITDRSAGPVRSACPSCGATLSWADLIPFFSWVFLRGRCRHCGTEIPARYPLTELAVMMLTLLQFWAWGPQPALIPVLLAVPFLVAAAIIDWEHMILPDSINISLLVLAVSYVAILTVFAGMDPSVAAAHAGAAVLICAAVWLAGMVVGRIKGRSALGLGDMKFLAPAGLFLGFPPMAAFLVTAGVAGLVTAFLWGWKGQKGAFPFGPALIFSLYFHLFLTGLGFDYTW